MKFTYKAMSDVEDFPLDPDLPTQTPTHMNMSSYVDGTFSAKIKSISDTQKLDIVLFQGHCSAFQHFLQVAKSWAWAGPLREQRGPGKKLSHAKRGQTY